MITLEKEFRFEASHQLIHHDGKCSRLHGHSWVGQVVLCYDEQELPKTGAKQGMAQDYYDISQALKPLVEDYLDHRHLNDTVDEAAPTSERVAMFCYHKLKPSLPNLIAVVIEETCSSRCEYQP
jgi:6-pyruvoyltetrahydropterin/6-carboxytetrahydropterin synthase